MPGRVAYLRRVAAAYLGKAPSQLTFWHEPPEINERAFSEPCGEYYHCFFTKADYDAHRDTAGIPMLDYRGHVGRQYNPIAIAQWGLGNFNRFRRTNAPDRRARFLAASNWLVANLSPNTHGVPVWKHHFDWEYRDTLKSGWYSALSQGQGVSLLCRAYGETGELRYLDAAREAFRSMTVHVREGGVTIPEGVDGCWLEESIVDPPTHILNGFLWAAWGVHDFAVTTGDDEAEDLLEACRHTARRQVPSYDCGYWSLYEHSGTRLKMLASPFYHRLHISQLRITARLLRISELNGWAARWQSYAESGLCARRAFVAKAIFKLAYY
jgi:heparosan-N-sulfate-glucuronate 5-epimerase